MSTTNNSFEDILVTNEEDIFQQEPQESATDTSAVQGCAADESMAEETREDDAYYYDALPEEEPPEEPDSICKTATNAPPPMQDAITAITDRYLEQYSCRSHPAPAVIRAELLHEIRLEFGLVNACMEKESKWPVPSELPDFVIVRILVKLHNVSMLALGTESQDSELDQIGCYVSSGPKRGTYTTERSYLKKLCSMYRATINKRILETIEFQMETEAPRRFPTDDPKLIAVNNGVFNYETKELMDFSPEMVFLTKTPVNYVANVTNPILHDPKTGLDWDVETWMSSLSDDPEIVEVLWQAVGAAIRPGIPWNKSLFLVSPQGNNGKGTLCQMIRYLCGNGNCMALQLSDMGRDFMLEPLIRASAIITDENDVSDYVDKAANFKSIITHDVLQVNRKHKTPINYRFRGFMIQCLNDFPDFRDKSQSLYRRILMVPMDKCFTGAENKKIKSEYIRRKDVLEYVLNRVLNMNYYELSEPASCVVKKDEFEEANDVILQFAAEIMPQLAWSLAPNPFLYDLYTQWSYRNNPSGKLPSRNTFIRKLNALVDNNPDWGWSQHPSKSDIRVKNLMDYDEPLTREFHLNVWADRRNYKAKYRGLVRTTVLDSCVPCASGAGLSNDIVSILEANPTGNSASNQSEM